MDILFESLNREWQGLVQLLPRLALSLIVFVIFVVIGRLLGRGVENIVHRSDLPDTHGGFFRKLVMWLFVFLGVLVGMNLLGLRSVAAGLLTGGGVTAIVLGFAFREIGENFLAGFFLAFSRPFRIGDMVESGGLSGVVQGIELRYAHVRSADGRDIFIPSSNLFKEPLINYTRDGLRRFTVTVGIDYGDEPVKATRLLLDAVGRVEGVLADPAPGVLISGLRDSWVELQVFCWVNTFDPAIGLGAAQTAAMAAVRETLRSNGYTLSCDTVANQALSMLTAVDVALAPASTG